MELIAFDLSGNTTEIRPAPVERDWMNASRERFAYRCLPLNIANSYGWEILSPGGFKAVWNGRDETEAIKIYPKPGELLSAMSHFGHGVLTFSATCLFRTPPGFDLWVQGPVNSVKDGIAPLTGVIETDWAPYTFTMNWKFTRPGAVVSFEKGEPFCHFFPIRRGEIEAFDPRVASLSENPELLQQHERWEESRKAFIEDLKTMGSVAQEERWQKLYYQGRDADGKEVKTADHRTRVRLRSFARASVTNL
ncbi:MAG: hypothetical protein HY243_19085 [Proteobacteria bacterium]|nr:hypothetical protein [Pseudomonadota bacterium]